MERSSDGFHQWFAWTHEIDERIRSFIDDKNHRPVRPVPNILPDALHGTHSMIVASTRELANVIFISANDRNICPQQRSVGTELEPALAGLSFSLSSCAVCLAGRGNDL